MASLHGDRRRNGQRRRWLAPALAMVAVLGLGAGGNRTEAYRFYDNGGLDFIVGSDQALRWSEDAWGPGGTLVWEIEDGEDWSLLFDSAEDMRPLVEEALGIWSGIETADISWRVSGVASLSDEEPRFGDSRSRVFLERRQGRTSEGDVRYYYRRGTFLWWVRNRTRSTWELTDCDVGLPWDWWLDDDLQPEADLELDDVRDTIVRFAAEAFGRCLGLGDGAPFPGRPWLRRTAGSDATIWGSRRIWPVGPLMHNYWRELSADDRTAASLLRPRIGWGNSVGSVSGRLEVEGAAAPYVHVYAIRSTAAGMRNPVGAFANVRGEFLIEGLPPGEYILWALPVRYYWNHQPLLLEGAATDLKDAVVAHPVRVEAGRVTDGIEIPMRSGRQ